MNSILVRLYSKDVEDREKAVDELEKSARKGWTSEEGRTLLVEAGKNFPPRKYSVNDTSAALISAVCNDPRPEYIPIILENFPRYNETARWWALRLLSLMPDANGQLPILELIRTYAEQGEISDLPIDLIKTRPQESKILFPDILHFTKTKIGIKIYDVCLASCEAGLLSPEMLDPYSSDLVDVYASYKDRLFPLQKNEGISWMWEDNYLDLRYDAGLLLDVMGYFPGEGVADLLVQSLQYLDPRLKLFAAISLLRKGIDVPELVVHEIAASSETRNVLFQRLSELGRSQLFPESFKTQEAFAESDMVGWLIFPTELGRVPDEIELMKVISIDTKTNGPLDYYVLRFRTHPPHWASKDGWMAGTSGPFLRRDEPSTMAYGDTFSSFQPWESKTAEEHVGDTTELLTRWADYHFGKDN